MNRTMEDVMSKPTVGIVCGFDGKDVKARAAYVDATCDAGGLPLLLPPLAKNDPEQIDAYFTLCDAFIFTGGFDPVTEPYNEPTHPKANRESERRQAFDVALLRELSKNHRDKPVLGVCLGMQMMALEAGGALDQHMPESVPTHAEHMDDQLHEIRVETPAPTETPGTPVRNGTVTSWHRQAVRDAGSLRVVARAHDGVIEAIDDPSRAFYLGVQWHPERTADDANGLALFRSLINE